MAGSSFSFQELREADKVSMPEPEKLEAGDGIMLAYRRYAPSAPRAVLLFYHGGGAHSGLGYQYPAAGLQTGYDVLVYTPDIRGHGASGGPHGDAPSPNQVWADIGTLIRHVRTENPELPLFVGGHSSGASVVLNYASQPDREAVTGYVFLSPQLGVNAQVDRPAQPAPFATVDGAAFAAYAASGGTSHGHDYAVKFNYPAEMLASDPGLVEAITIHMSVALVPFAPHDRFKALDHPFGLWIGSDDELFLPDKVLAFADLATAVRARSEVGLIPGGKHLGVLVKAHETIGPWIERMIAQRPAGS